MSTYDVYKQFGRVIGEREWNLTLKCIHARWYEKPFIKFGIWIEQCKRWLKADIRLASDNPFRGCLNFCLIVLIIIVLICLMIFLKTLK